jgi:phosphoglycolate phosphatase
VPDYQLLIFDWDGTLVDSIGRIVEAMHRAADVASVPRCSDGAVRGIIGLELGVAIRALYPELEEPRLIETIRRAYSEQYLALEAEPSQLFEGVRESLDAFRQQGYQLAVATGKGRKGLQRVLADKGWLDYFDITRCADETASKPDPLMLHEILAHCRVPPERALMVGDSTFDLLMARNAGMDAVAVGFGAQPLSVLLECSPCLAINQFNELRVWLESYPAQRSSGVSEHVG